MEAAIGVIGLSLQLIDSAVKVKRAIGNYRSASTEINRLALKVERVEAICGAIKRSLEGEPSTRQCSGLIETWGVCVLRSVQSTLAELNDIIAKLEKKAAKKRILNAAGMAFLEKKDDITRLSKCLDEDLNHLQHMMMAEIFSQCSVVQQLVVHQPHSQATSSIEGQASLTCSGSYANASGGPSVTEKVITSNQRVLNAFGFRGQSQSVRILKKSRWLNNNEMETVKEFKTYNFGLSGISYRVEFHWHLSMASPVVYAMNIRHIISKNTDSELVQDIQKAMCGGNLQALQRMISAKKFTLGSLFGDKTLFELAAWCRQPAICRFLAQQNIELCLDEHICRPDNWLGYSWINPQPTEIRRRVFEIDDIVQLTQISRALRFRLLAFRLEDIESLVALYHRCNELNLDLTEKQDLVNAAWDAAICLFASHDPRNPFSFQDDPLKEVWTKFFIGLISEGVDVHRLINSSSDISEAKRRGDYTALFWILRAYRCHRETEVALSRWLRILQVTPIDINGYLCHEAAFCQERWDSSPVGWTQSLSMKNIEGFEVPFWRRFVDPLSKAYDVRHEFRNFGSLYPVMAFPRHQFVLKLASDDHQQHITTKNNDLDPQIEMDWPFIHSFVQDFDSKLLRGFSLSVKEQSNIERACFYARELMQSRFERRQTRKLYKSGYLKREKRLIKIPGAWPNLEW